MGAKVIVYDFIPPLFGFSLLEVFHVTCIIAPPNKIKEESRKAGEQESREEKNANGQLTTASRTETAK